MSIADLLLLQATIDKTLFNAIDAFSDETLHAFRPTVQSPHSPVQPVFLGILKKVPLDSAIVPLGRRFEIAFRLATESARYAELIHRLKLISKAPG